MTLSITRLSRPQIFLHAKRLAAFLASRIGEEYMTPSDISYGRYPVSDKAHLAECIEDEFKIRARTDNDLEILAARAASEFVAICVVSANRSTRSATIEDFAVAAEYERTGCGSALLAYSMRRLKRAGITQVYAEVSVRNKGAEAFFIKNFFAPAATVFSRSLIEN